MKTAVPTSKLRRWWRWMWRLGLIGVILATALGWWAWRERVLLVNAALRRFGGDVQVKIATLEWKDGALHVGKVTSSHASGAQNIASADHLEWRPQWSHLSSGNLGGFKVNGATVDVPLSWFEPSAPQPAGAPAAASRRWHLDLVDLAPTKFVLRDAAWQPVFSVMVTQKVEALEIGGIQSPSFQTIVTDLQHAEWHGKPVFDSVHLESVMLGDKLEIKQVSLSGGRIDLAWLKEFSPALSAKLPPLSGGVELEWKGKNMGLSSAGLTAGGTHEVRLKKLHLQPLNAAGRVDADVADVKVSQDLNGLWHVERGLMLKPVIEWTRELEAALLPKSESKQASAWKMKIDAFELKDGTVKLSPTELCPVAGEVAWSTRLEALELSQDGLQSAVKQTLSLANLSLRWARGNTSPETRPFVQMKSAALELVPDKLRELRQVESLAMAEPQFEFTPENGPWFDKIQAEPVAKPLEPSAPWWKQLQFATLTLKDGSVELAMMLAERMETSIHFDVMTEQAKQRLRITNTQVRIPKRANLPVLSIENVEAVASLPEMWRKQRLESLKLDGGQVEVGEALTTLFSGKAEVVEQKVEAASARWTAGRIDVEKLGVTLMSIAPGLPPVRFDVNFAANETPLDLDGLAENVEPQRIMLTRLRIPSPYEPLRTVAEMDVIHVNYTLDGLLHRHIERVEIVSPLLYVGEDLFWYVENIRKSMKGEAPKQDPTFGPPKPPEPVAPAWHVNILAVTDGRLLLAPKGVPLKGFSKPFPFSFTSKLESGQLDAVFEIPTDTYTLEDKKLEFRGMKGQVLFNLPLKDRSNNLTETFTVEQLRWKDLHLENGHLSVTYDVHGIYGTFGGEAYKGYVNGAFDIYLDEAYTWDGWVSGADVNLGPVTKALFPNYFLLDGATSGKVVATGNITELYQADAEFNSRSRGKFSIQALNDLIDDLPPVMKGDIADQITRIGLETLRDFEYEDIDGKVRFYGREGRGHLRFTGPSGARKIDVNVYDHRWKEDPRKPETADAVE
ncbi:hypothetical protein [Prosthecobacter sp.]|uniref:hypothetical protein n=1 Tax=Prosthecobacter sp. TaxID=1965333 RepID=UPI001D57E542|nr:hypothetical protein [Prosthecobacter sp.]MCB1277145.1 hypothetical protein [Prosthecobacter sp.]